MSFLWPLALFSLITIPLILLLHLLRNRREQLDIPSLLFWRGLEQKRQGGQPRHIPLSLLLLLQLLIAVALTLGLARPTLSFVLNQPQQTIFVLDMTTSMTAVDVPQTGSALNPIQRFDLARDVIRSQIETMAEQDRLVIISLAPQPEILMAGNGGQKTDLLAVVDNLVPGATGVNLTAALSLASSLVDPKQQNQIVVLTDGNYTGESQPLPPILAPIEWRFIPDAPAGNQALFHVSTRPLPDGRHRVFTRVANYSDTPVARTLRLWADETVVQEEVVQIEAQADEARLWTLPESSETAAVEIIEADKLPLDNRAELFLINSALRRVLLVSEKPENLVKALEAQPGVEVTITTDFSDYDLGEFELVIFDGLPVELTTWPRGNLLVINPSLGHPLLPAENFARNLRPDLVSASSLLAGIDLSGVYFGRVARLAAPAWADIDLAAGGSEQSLPLIFHGTVDNSRVMVWTFDLVASNLPARLALPLLTANMLSTLLAPSPLAVSPVGAPVLLARNFSVETPDGQRLFMESGSASAADNLFTRTKKPGLYRIYNSSNTLVAGFAVHAGSPLESNLGQRQWQPETLTTVEAATTPAPDLEIDYQDFWPWLAGLALVVVIVEGWLAWRR
jgi:hypothetical protein